MRKGEKRLELQKVFHQLYKEFNIANSATSVQYQYCTDVAEFLI